jgi:hypothetical protein
LFYALEMWLASYRSFHLHISFWLSFLAKTFFSPPFFERKKSLTRSDKTF